MYTDRADEKTDLVVVREGLGQREVDHVAHVRLKMRSRLCFVLDVSDG